jgi:tRNA1Val (adenine37-N6)-methyltransferase
MSGDFRFKKFTIQQDRCAMKVTEIACIFGAWIPVHKNDQRILDIGSGTGLLGLMLAQRCNARVDMVEMNSAAVQQCRENIDASPFRDRIQVYEKDICKYVSLAPYDLIVCNPPFFENQLVSNQAEKNMAWHSSHLTLEELAFQVNRLANDRSRMAILLPKDRMNEWKTLMIKDQWHCERELHIRHSDQHPFKYIVAIYQKQTTIREIFQMTIREKQEYCPEIKTLLSDYYLKF